MTTVVFGAIMVALYGLGTFWFMGYAWNLTGFIAVELADIRQEFANLSESKSDFPIPRVLEAVSWWRAGLRVAGVLTLNGTMVGSLALSGFSLTDWVFSGTLLSFLAVEWLVLGWWLPSRNAKKYRQDLAEVREFHQPGVRLAIGRVHDGSRGQLETEHLRFGGRTIEVLVGDHTLRLFVPLRSNVHGRSWTTDELVSVFFGPCPEHKDLAGQLVGIRHELCGGPAFPQDSEFGRIQPLPN